MLKYKHGGKSEFLAEQFPALMSSEQTPSRSFLTFCTRVTATNDQALRTAVSHAPTGCRSFMAIGLRLNACITRIHGTRPRPVRMPLGVSTTTKSSELSIERERISPSPVLLVCDAQAKFVGVDADEEQHCVTYQVVGNKATRLVDFFCDADRIAHHASEAVALLLIGGVQLAYTTQASVWCMPTSINSPMSNGMQVSRPDYMFTHLTTHELYLAGRNGIYRSMIGTPWETCFPERRGSPIAAGCRSVRRPGGRPNHALRLRWSNGWPLVRDTTALVRPMVRPTNCRESSPPTARISSRSRPAAWCARR